MPILLIDSETKECLDVVNEGDSVRVTKANQREYMESTIPVPIVSFVKVNADEVKLLREEMENGEYAFLMRLIAYVSYKDNCVKNGRHPMSIDEISRVFRMGRSRTSELVNKLVQMDILYKGKNSREYQLFMNPWIACRGNRCNKVLSTMFRHYRIRSMGGVKWEKYLTN